jgi:hypothetical protein
MSEAEDRRDDAAEQPRPKRPWTRPSVTLLGRVADLVHGAGKTGPNEDSDPAGTRKKGTG